ncbi:MAG: peptidoglycan-binding domain-containing protein, partial [Rhodanobacter sp.]
MKTNCYMIWILALMTTLASAQAVATSANRSLTSERINGTALVVPVQHGSEGVAVLRAQIRLDRARFSPGEIDAAYRSNMCRASAGFPESRGLPLTGEVDAATGTALGGDGAP